MKAPQEIIDVVDWRRRVGSLYRLKGPGAITQFRDGRNELFRTHPQSPISPEARRKFRGLRYFEPNPKFRVTAKLMKPDDNETVDIETGGEDGTITYQKAGSLE